MGFIAQYPNIQTILSEKIMLRSASRFLSTAVQPLVRAASSTQGASSASPVIQNNLSGLRTRYGASLSTQAGSSSPVNVTSTHVKNTATRVENLAPESLSPSPSPLSEVTLPTASQMASWTPVQAGGSVRAFSSTPSTLRSS